MAFHMRLLCLKYYFREHIIKHIQEGTTESVSSGLSHAVTISAQKSFRRRRRVVVIFSVTVTLRNVLNRFIMIYYYDVFPWRHEIKLRPCSHNSPRSFFKNLIAPRFVFHFFKSFSNKYLSDVFEPFETRRGRGRQNVRCCFESMAGILKKHRL